MPQNSFLSPERTINGQMNTIDLNALTAHFSALYGTAKQKQQWSGMPEPRLESTTNTQIRSPGPQNSFLSPESIFNGNEHDQFERPYSAFLGLIRHGGTKTSQTATRTPSAAPLHTLPNSPDTATLHLSSPLSSQSQASICLCAAP